MKATPVQVADWIDGRFAVLGTDGFGRSDTREALRRLHKIDAECIAVTVLAELAGLGEIDTDVVGQGHRAVRHRHRPVALHWLPAHWRRHVVT